MCATEMSMSFCGDSVGISFTRSTSQSAQREKPERYSTLHTGQNITRMILRSTQFRLPVPGKRCGLNRSMQHHPKHCYDTASPGEPICLPVVDQNLARVVFRPIQT